VVERVKGWPGVGLSGQEFNQVPHTEWAPNLRYSFAAGEAVTRFLEDIEKGKLTGRRCHECGKITFPPRMFCEECYRPTDEWVQIRDTGTIETFSVSFVDLDARRIKDPIFVGVVVFDGPDFQAPETGRQRMGMMHYFGQIEKDAKSPTGYAIHVGQRVKAVWKPAGEREGSVLDIRYFRPMAPSEDPFAKKRAAAGKPRSKRKGGR
jgi:uncharacterized OB-fold protein